MSYEKVVENLLQRMASRQGFRLVKSHRRDPKVPDYGTYMLLDARTNVVVAGDDHSLSGGFGLSLDEVEEYLRGDYSRAG
jgi:hypothetical protein